MRNRFNSIKAHLERRAATGDQKAKATLDGIHRGGGGGEKRDRVDEGVTVEDEEAKRMRAGDVAIVVEAVPVMPHPETTTTTTAHTSTVCKYCTMGEIAWLGTIILPLFVLTLLFSSSSFSIPMWFRPCWQCDNCYMIGVYYDDQPVRGGIMY